MTPSTALLVWVAFVVWLFLRDRAVRRGVSAALWIPTLWAAIIGSRPASNWFGASAAFENPDDYLEGSPVDRLVFQGLIGVAVIVLAQRRLNWNRLASRNRWLLFYFAYFCVSVVWADFPFTAFKRWIKDVGNLAMALVVLSDADPVKAFRAVLARCTYLLVPASVLLVRYYPELGRSYDRWTYEPYIQGVTLFKNQLGMTVTVCVLYLVWELLQNRNRTVGRFKPVDLVNHLMLLAMGIYLLRVAKSATSLTCSFLGAASLVALYSPAVRKHADRFVPRFVGWAAILVPLFLIFDVPGLVLDLLGRDATLTGRTDIWSLVLAEDLNPLIGAGFYSFWTGERIARYWQMYGQAMNQAHNGYLETYLIGGLAGVCLLGGMLFYSGKAILKELAVDFEWNAIRLVFWCMTLIHNFTEASYSKLSLLWVLFLTVAFQYPRTTGGNNSKERRFGTGT